MPRVSHPDLLEALRLAGLPTLGAWARVARVSWTRFGIYRRPSTYVPAQPLSRLAKAIGLPPDYTLGLLKLPRKQEVA